MSNTWPPQQEPPPETGWPPRQRADEHRFPQHQRGPNSAPRPYGVQHPYGPYSSQPSQPPSYDEADSGYRGYGTPGPSSGGRHSRMSPEGDESWSNWGGAPAQEQYQPGEPPPYYPQYPQYPQAPYGAPYPHGIQDPYGPYSSPPPPSPRSRFSLVEVVLVLLIAIIIAATGFWALTRYGPFAINQPTNQPAEAQATVTSQAQGTTTSTPGDGFHLYSNAAMGVQFDIPNGWTTQNAATSYGPGVQANSPDGNGVLSVGVIDGRTGNNIGAANGGLAGVADSGSVDVTEGPSQTTFAGASWVQEAADLTRSGVRLHAVIYVGAHNLNTFLLLFIATTSSFAAFNTHDFQATTKSFQFLS